MTAPPPPQVAKAPSTVTCLHAHVVVSKCVDSLPLYRQAEQLTRAGAQVSRSTLGDLFHRSAELLPQNWHPPDGAPAVLVADPA